MTDTCTQAEPSKAMTTVLPATTPPKRPTKKAQLIKLLSGTLGTDVAPISAKFGWQPHTTRAALVSTHPSTKYDQKIGAYCHERKG